MKYAIINSKNAVENIALAEPDFAAVQGWVAVPEGQPVGIGWNYDGQNFTKPTIDEKEDQEAGWKAVRSMRDKLLEETDTFMLVDRFNSLSSERQHFVTEYRQNLRNMPQDYSDYLEVVWPEKPNFLLF